RLVAAAALPAGDGGRAPADQGRPVGWRERAARGRQLARPEAARRAGPGHAARVLPVRSEEAVGLAGTGRVGGLRALDAREQAAHAATVGRGAIDERVPARRSGRRVGIRLSRRYAPAIPAQGAYGSKNSRTSGTSTRLPYSAPTSSR